MPVLTAERIRHTDFLLNANVVIIRIYAGNFFILAQARRHSPRVHHETITHLTHPQPTIAVAKRALLQFSERAHGVRAHTLFLCLSPHRRVLSIVQLGFAPGPPTETAYVCRHLSDEHTFGVWLARSLSPVFSPRRGADGIEAKVYAVANAIITRNPTINSIFPFFANFSRLQRIFAWCCTAEGNESAYAAFVYQTASQATLVDVEREWDVCVFDLFKAAVDTTLPHKKSEMADKVFSFTFHGVGFLLSSFFRKVYIQAWSTI